MKMDKRVRMMEKLTPVFYWNSFHSVTLLSCSSRLEFAGNGPK